MSFPVELAVALLLCRDAAPSPAVAARAAPPQIWVDARGGDDPGGDGSADKPFRTLVKAFSIRAQMEEPWVEVRLRVGAHAAGAGEAFPVLVPPGVRIVGYGAASSEWAGRSEAPVVVLPAAGRVAIEGITLRGGTAGIVAAGRAGRLELELIDVAIEEVAVGVDLTRAEGELLVRVDGLRTRAQQTGLHADAGAALSLDVSRSWFIGGVEGLVLDDGRAGAGGPDRTVALRDCRFDRPEGAGFVRRGAVGREADGAPFTFDRCEFRGSRMGLLFELPAGDVPVVARDCRFLENLNFGLCIVGSGTPRDGESRFERCEFRWNGLGAQLLAAGRSVRLVDCRVEDSIGIGISAGNFTGPKSTVTVERCVIARNGLAGLFAISEQPEGLVVRVDRCTVVDNRGNGIERKNRKFGGSDVKVTRSIVAGHAQETVKLESSDLIGCHLGGEPGFVDRDRRDWRLRGDATARDAEGPLGALPQVTAAASGGGR
jgi:hypothetical protein